MFKNLFKNKIFILFAIIFLNKDLNSRVFFTPSLEIWKQYTSTWNYDFENYRAERGYNLIFDSALAFQGRNSYSCWTNCCGEKKLENLAALFHGSDNFLYDQVRTVSDITSDYKINPSYKLNESSCSVILQISKDFSYCDNDIKSTFRVIVPFVSNSVINNNSGQMYYQVSGTTNRNISDFKKVNNTLKGNLKTDLTPYFSLKKEGNNNVFAVRGDGIYEFYNNQTPLFFEQPIINPPPYMVISKFIYPFDETNQLTISDILNGYILTEQQNGVPYYTNNIFNIQQERVGYFTNIGTRIVAPIEFVDPINNRGAWLVLCQYSTPDTGGFFVKDDSLNHYPIYITPDPINTLKTDALQPSPIYYFDNQNTVYSSGLPAGSTISILASGQYNNIPFNQDYVSFTNPPVIFQKSSPDSFPQQFGFNITLPNHQYTDITNQYQFDTYNPYSSKNKITFLNSDGTFFNSNADFAILSWQNDYTQIFTNPTPEQINNLQNIYMTSALTNNNTVEPASQIIYDTLLGNEPCPDIDTIKKEIASLEQQYLFQEAEVSQLKEQINLSDSLSGITNPKRNTSVKEDKKLENKSINIDQIQKDLEYDNISEIEPCPDIDTITKEIDLLEKQYLFQEAEVSQLQEQVNLSNSLSGINNPIRNKSIKEDKKLNNIKSKIKNQKLKASNYSDLENRLAKISDLSTVIALQISDLFTFETFGNQISAIDTTRSIDKKVENKSINIDQLQKDLENEENILNRNSADSELFINGIPNQLQYNEFNQIGLGDIYLELLLGQFALNDKILYEFIFGLQIATSANINSNDSYLAIPLGANGHYVGRLGIQGGYDFTSLLKGRISTKFYLEHAFNGYEQLIPGVQGKPIFGFIPVKMDTNVSWNAGLFILEAAVYATKDTNFSVGYQYWRKATDNISMLNNIPVEIPPSYNSENVNFCGTTELSNRSSQTIFASISSHVLNDSFLSVGLSGTVSGTNTAAVLDYFITFTAEF